MNKLFEDLIELFWITNVSIISIVSFYQFTKNENLSIVIGLFFIGHLLFKGLKKVNGGVI